MNCYLCHSSSTFLQSGKVRGSAELKIYACNECKLVFLSSRNHVTKEFYENSKMTISSGIHGESPLDIDELIKYTKKDDLRRFHYLKNKVKEKKLLDFGCGAGGFLKYIKNISTISHGIELENRLYPIFDKEKLCVYKRLLDIPKDLQNIGYDYITLFHVLEHIADPIKLLNKLKDFLAPGGEIIIEVPNSDDALISLYKNKAYQEFIYWNAHVFYFNSHSFKFLASKLNLEVNYELQIQRYPFENHLYWLIYGKSGGHENWEIFGSKALNSAYESCLAQQKRCDTILVSISNQ